MPSKYPPFNVTYPHLGHCPITRSTFKPNHSIAMIARSLFTDHDHFPMKPSTTDQTDGWPLSVSAKRIAVRLTKSTRVTDCDSHQSAQRTLRSKGEYYSPNGDRLPLFWRLFDWIIHGDRRSECLARTQPVFSWIGSPEMPKKLAPDIVYSDYFLSIRE